MQRILYYLLAVVFTCRVAAQSVSEFTTEDVIADIYSVLLENGEADYEEVHERLTELAARPINLNTATAEDLSRLMFLSDSQIDAILLYVYQHPMVSVAELQLVAGLSEWDIRDLLPFVYVASAEQRQPFYWREVFTRAKHEINTRVDARYVEDPKREKQADPVYTRLRYTFRYQDQVQAGWTLQRPTGGSARQLLYGGYVQLKDIHRLKALVLGNYQAQFGQGLVAAYPFHPGKAAYVSHMMNLPYGLRKYSSVSETGLHGAGVSMQAHRMLDVSAWYSLTRENDSLRRHCVGANMTVHGKRWQAGVTATENIWSDTLRYYYEHARYNQHYFRGVRQFVGGAHFRWQWHRIGLFGEGAVSENRRWGWAVVAGGRYTPVSDVDLLLLYRYYSPWFDNTNGYAFSETSRINDENGIYVGVDVRRLAHWRLSAYGDLFRFSGIKYGIPYRPSLGYDAMGEATYCASERWQTGLRLRAREKGKKSSYSVRWRMDVSLGSWQLRMQADGVMGVDSLHHRSYGYSVYQDVSYRFRHPDLTIQTRLQGFSVPQWDNRVYNYEHDVLYGGMIPALYGKGARWYVNLRWQIIKPLCVYLRVSETIYTSSWKAERNLVSNTRTDVHLLLRATL